MASYVYLERSNPANDVEYPLSVTYCGECSMPTEYCEYSHCPDKCRIWLETNLPEEFEKLKAGGEDPSSDLSKKSRQSRGGKGAIKAAPKPKLSIFRSPRGGKKFTTSIVGLGTFDAAKYFGTHFACGCSNKGGEIVIQGDFKENLIEVIQDKWPQIDTDSITDLGDMKR